MGHRILVWLMVISLLGLVGCGENSSQTVDNSSNNSPSSTTSVQLSLCTSYTEEGMYRADQIMPGTANLLYTDFDNLREIVLCAKPECSHQEDACVSYFDRVEEQGIPGVVIVANKLLLYRDSPDGAGNLCIETADLNGQNRKILYTASGHQILQGNIYQDGTSVYFTAYTISDDGEYAQELCRLNLMTGNCQTLHRFPSDVLGLEIKGCMGSRLLLYRVRQVNDFEVLTEVCQFDAAEPERELETIDVIESGELACLEPPYTYSWEERGTSLTQRQIDTGEEVQFDLTDLQKSQPEDARMGFRVLFDGCGCITFFGTTEAGDSYFHFYTLDLVTGAVAETKLTQQDRPSNLAWIAAQTDDSLCVLTGYANRTINVPVEGVTTPVTYYQPQYAMISKEAYKQGKPDYTPIEQHY